MNDPNSLERHSRSTEQRLGTKAKRSTNHGSVHKVEAPNRMRDTPEPSAPHTRTTVRTNLENPKNLGDVSLFLEAIDMPPFQLTAAQIRQDRATLDEIEQRFKDESAIDVGASDELRRIIDARGPECALRQRAEALLRQGCPENLS